MSHSPDEERAYEAWVKAFKAQDVAVNRFHALKKREVKAYEAWAIACEAADAAYDAYQAAKRKARAEGLAPELGADRAVTVTRDG